MYSKSLILSLALPLLLALSGCKKVIQVDLNNAAPQIVIEGEITNLPGPYLVKISKTVNFSVSNVFPPVSGAIVQLTDSNNGLIAHMTETSPGTYSANLFGGVPLHTYKLSVSVEGKEYTASSTMPQPVTLDSVTFVQNFDFNNKSVINAVVNFQDPPGPANYYQFTESVNNIAVPDILVFEDRLSDGKYIRETLFNDTSRMQVNDSLLLQMYAVDENSYQYFFTLQQVTGNNSFRSATPANPISNISNGALGYFSAHTITRRKLRVY
ncbi:MAG TPA: DUF4249 domain-containing protein [Puia sp.]|nr:DUF4249 domain-containing protein [Puia sp.]